MNWLDIVIILAVLGSVASAYGAGLIREVVTLVSIIIGVVAAGLLYDDLASDVLVFIDDETTARAASFLILFGAVDIFGQTTAYLLKRLASLLMLGWADRLGGALFGLLKGLIVVEVLLVLFAAYPVLGLEDAIDASEIAPYFLDDAPAVLWVLPGEFDDLVDRFLTPPAP